VLGMFGEADGRHLKRSVVGPVQAASAAWRACASFGPRALLALSAGNTLHADSLGPSTLQRPFRQILAPTDLG
jgi:hypothetical protein